MSPCRLLHRAACASSQDGSCVLKACIPTDGKWKLPGSQGLSLKIGTRQLPLSAIIVQAVTEPTQIQAEETKFPPRNRRNVKEFAATHSLSQWPPRALPVQMSPGSKTQQSGLGFQEQLSNSLNWLCKRASANLYLNPSGPSTSIVSCNFSHSLWPPPPCRPAWMSQRPLTQSLVSHCIHICFQSHPPKPPL